MGILLSIYHGLPYPARCMAASVHGLRLRHQRYGPETEALVEEARQRESWSPAQWQAWREERLAYVLHRAATRVPYYRDQWAERRRRGDRASWDQLENWPVLEKEHVRAAPERFIADDRPPGRLMRDHTSGTTGTPLTLYRGIGPSRALHAIAAVRTRFWHGASLRDRWARFGGKPVIPLRSRRPPFWVWNATLHQLYLSCYHLAPDLVPHYLDALARYRIQFISGATSSLLALAREALALGRRDLRMRFLLTTGEGFFDEQRRMIEEAFQCPLRETYGMGEMVLAASECPEGRLHLWPEVGHLELHGPDGPVPHGETGEIVATSLLNTDMPLIRYRVGDFGRLPHGEAPCACGRTLPVLGRIEGRMSDILLTRDGRRVWWLNPVFYGLPVREAQIVQHSLDRVTLRFVPAPEFTAAHAAALVGRLRERLGEVAVELEQVAEVPRTAAGKVRAAVCNVSAEEREAALAATRSRH